MRRAILFLIFALFLAMVIQPNLNKQIKEIVAKEQVLREEIDKIVKEIEE